MSKSFLRIVLDTRGQHGFPWHLQDRIQVLHKNHNPILYRLESRTNDAIYARYNF